ncbi:hypothetical protein K439DRAFT_1634226 [Ramaria rubella]|nr:hypothetical protein K439DRAFT_1634226 [Ramaria rubella]
MRFIAITSILFAASQVAVSAPIYSLARRAQDGVGAAIPAWSEVAQRDENDEDLFVREVANVYARESFSDTHDGLLTRTLKRRGGPRKKLDDSDVLQDVGAKTPQIVAPERIKSFAAHVHSPSDPHSPGTSDPHSPGTSDPVSTTRTASRSQRLLGGLKGSGQRFARPFRGSWKSSAPTKAPPDEARPEEARLEEARPEEARPEEAPPSPTSSMEVHTGHE